MVSQLAGDSADKLLGLQTPFSQLKVKTVERIVTPIAGDIRCVMASASPWRSAICNTDSNEARYRRICMQIDTKKRGTRSPF